MINFETKNSLILFSYQADRDSNYWVVNKLETAKSVTFQRTFSFNVTDLYNEDVPLSDIDEFDPVVFVFARLEGDYYKICDHVLSLGISVYFHKDIQLYPGYFVSIKNISIFRKIRKLISQDIYIGGENEYAIPFDDFIDLVNKFPNSYELEKYAQARVSQVITNYFDNTFDAKSSYNKYMNKKLSKHGAKLISTFRDSEIFKFKAILSKIQEMLVDENSYNEKQWQKEIAEIILLLNPKYIRAFQESPVRDSIKDKNKKVDFLLVDSSGAIDIAEIKKPFDSAIVTHGMYRDNYIPLRELTGTVMQIEKYIFHLNKWGEIGEKTLTGKYKNELPDGFQIKITNPNGIVIMGRDNNLSPHQKSDFEVIKRKYKNIIDIVTYDDLIRRLHFVIQQLQNET